MTSHDKWGPAEEAMILLSQLGGPEHDLNSIEGQNTAQEMLALSKTIEPEARVGLITSAGHMKRALRLAHSQGLDPVPLPADFQTPPVIRPNVFHVVPSAHACVSIRDALKEYLAYIVGR